VKIEDMFSPVYSANTYRGLWKLNGGFMGGPFLIKTYFIDKKVVVTVGLIFAPDNRKRNYIRTLEAIL
jgi:DNA helicase TIP49 (TBP-interacting protein)